MSHPRARANMLLVVIILTTIITLLLAMTMAPVNTATTRAKERELVYRGEHLAAGIRRYYGKFGRFPFDLEELIEQEPRFIRKLYPDPMTKDGEWTLVYLTTKDQTAIKGLNRALSRTLAAQTGQEEGSGNELNSENVQEQTDSLFTSTRRQITGLRSKSDKEGLLVRDDSSIYSDWLFSALPKPSLNLGDLTNALDAPPGASSSPGTKP